MYIAELFGRLHECNKDHEIVDEFTKWIKEADPHELTLSSISDLMKTLENMFNSLVQDVPKKWKRCPKCGEPYHKICCLTDNERTREPTDIVPSIYSL